MECACSACSEITWRCETRWNMTYCKVATCDRNTHDTLSQVETHWIITGRSNPFLSLVWFRITCWRRSPLEARPRIFLSLSFMNFFLSTKEWCHTNLLLWEQPGLCAVSNIHWITQSPMFLSFYCKIKFNYRYIFFFYLTTLKIISPFV